MSIERTIEGLEIRLRSSGGGRFIGAAFLAAWLCAWTVGEGFVLWILIKGALALLTGTPPDPGREPLQTGPAVMIGLFLLVWLGFWTLGGIAAWAELFRLVWGEDRIRVASGQLTVTWRRGPFRASRRFERNAIRGVSLSGRSDGLMLALAREHVELSGLGDRAQRLEAAGALRSELVLAETPPGAPSLPAGWEEIITPEGERALVTSLATRRMQARVAGAIALMLALATFAVARDAVTRYDLIVPVVMLFAFTLAAACGAMWLAKGRMEWRIGSGRLTLRKRWAGVVRDVFEARRLSLDRTSDSDGDSWYELQALASADPAARPPVIQWRTSRPRDHRSVARRINDGPAVRDLAQWLSSEAGIPLDDLTTPEVRAAQLAELRALLEQSGRLGRWASKWVDRLGDVRKQA